MSIPQLFRRFDFTVLKNKSSTDNTQVPAAGTFTFYRQGATVKATTTLHPADPPPLRNLTVDDIGLIETGDWIAIGANGPTFEVTSLIDRNKVQIRFTDTNPLTIPAYTRLFAPSVQAHRDARGLQPLTPPYTNDSATGRFGCYVGAARFDFTVSGTGYTTRTYIDYDGGPAVGALGWLLARDFTSLEAAIAACPEHQESTIVLEPTLYLLSETLVLPVSKRIRLLGGGRDLSVLKCSNKDQPAVWIKGSWSSLEQLSIYGTGQAGEGAGVVIGRLAADQPTPPKVMERVSLRDVHINGSPSWGIDILGTDSPGCDGNSLSLFGRFEGVTIDSPLSNGAIRIRKGNTTQHFSDSQCLRFVGRAIHANGSDGLTFQDVTCESWSVADTPFAEFEDCRSVTILDGWFEEVPDPPPTADRPWFMHVHGRETDGFTVLGCIANRQPNPGVSPPPSYKSRAVRISDGVGATIVGLVTSTPDAPAFGQRREDIEITMIAGQNPKPDLCISGGVASSGGSPSLKSPLDVLFDPEQGYAQTNGSTSLRTFAALQPAGLPTFTDENHDIIVDSENWPIGSIIFNRQLNRIEFFDGTQWRFVNGTPLP